MTDFVHYYVILVHERLECIIDLVNNVTSFDHNAALLIYDGSSDGSLVPKMAFDLPNVEIIPHPRPMRWGRLHGYFVDCLDYLGDRKFDALTIIDSDQMMLRPNYSFALSKSGITPSTVFSPMPYRFDASHPMTPVASAHLEAVLWEPFVKRFQDGMTHFVHWTFWPGTVIGSDIAREIAFLLKDSQLNKILLTSRIWATEEILIPTLAKLLGGKVKQNPFSSKWNRFQVDWREVDLANALNDPMAFYIHPVKRLINDPIRNSIRSLNHT